MACRVHFVRTMKTPKPTATQLDALTRAIDDGARLIYLTGGWWTTESFARRTPPTWSVTRGTIIAMEAKGWLKAEHDHRDAPRVVTDDGRSIVAK